MARENSAQSTPAATRITVLGTGDGALLRSPLTDPDSNGVDATGAATDPAGNWNWVAADASIEPDFEGGENAFNVFDHKVSGGGNDKWCCDDPIADTPVWVAVQFANPVQLTHFTVTSGNDAPERDPTDWAIQGSNDGTTYTDIYHYTNSVDIWTARLQVVLFELPAASPAYTYLRYIAYETPGPLHQLSEIEYFGLQAGATFAVSSPQISYKGISFSATSTTTSTVDTNSIKLTIDSQPVATTLSVLGPNITVSYTPATNFALGTQHTYAIEVKDLTGQTVATNGTLTVPIGYFPLTDLPGPTPQGTNWALRFIYGSLSTNVGDINAALFQVTNVMNASFDAQTNDVVASEINFNGGGIFGNDNPYPTDVTNNAAWTGDNFVIEGVYNLNISQEGDYTFGIHSDDGFALRVRNARVLSVSGGGSADPNNPEAVVFPGGTGDSNTRAVYHLAAGTYRLELAYFESGGGDNVEVYWTRGAFTTDRTPNAGWTLLGSGATPIVLFPSGNLTGPVATNGAWAIRWIFGGTDEAGTLIAITSLGVALSTITNASTSTTLNGTVVDVTSPVINFNNGSGSGLFTNDLAISAEATNSPSWTGDNYVMLAVGNITVSTESDYTFGFHTDDGAGLRIVNGDLIAVHGGGGADLAANGAVVFPGTTGDSDTRAVYHLRQGTYRTEFIYFENGGGDSGELYVARGNFTNDLDTTTWALVGEGAAGLGPLVGSGGTNTNSSPNLTITRGSANTLTVSWADASYRLQSSTNIASGYTDVPNTSGTSATVTIDPADRARFYRLIK